MRKYVRSLCFILTKVVNDVLPKATTYIEHAVSKGYYFNFQVNEQTDKITDNQLDAIRKRMKEIAKANHPFISHEQETQKVIKLLKENEIDGKALLLETSSFIYSKHLKLDGYINYFSSSLIPSTGYITIFDKEPYL